MLQVMIRLRFPQNEAEWIGFAPSALFEAALSLHVLADPRHHALQAAWVRSCRALPPALRGELRHLLFVFRQFPPAFLLTSIEHGDVSFGDALEITQAASGEQVLGDLLLPFADHIEREPGEALHSGRLRDQLLQVATTEDRDATAILVEAFADPDSIRDRIIRLLEDYWSEAFSAEWSQLEPELTRDVARSVQVLAREGVEPMLRELVPEVLWNERRREAGLKRIHEHKVEVDLVGGITFIPSIFCWPHVRVYCDSPSPISLIYPVKAIRRPSTQLLPFERLIQVLRALADGTRLSILQLTAQQPRSTQELAVLLTLSEASISRHLHKMAEAGLLQVRREGRYVLYTCQADALESLSPGLLHLVRAAAPRSGSAGSDSFD
jgi:DNA-binding transcriptional ArsR family regulator